MDLNLAETSLVLAGAWNAAILTPSWVLKHGFGREEADAATRVQIFLPVVQGGTLEFAKIRTEGLTYVVRPDALIFAPNEAVEQLSRAEEVAAGIVGVLSHTPMTGIGHNFEFREPAPSPANVRLFTEVRQDLSDHMPSGWASGNVMVTSTFRSPNEAVHVNIARALEGDSLVVRFNFHHAIAGNAQALPILRGESGYNRMADNLAFAKRLINDLYEQNDQHQD